MTAPDDAQPSDATPPASAASPTPPQTRPKRRWGRLLLGAIGLLCVAVAVFGRTVARPIVADLRMSGDIYGLWDCDATSEMDNRPVTLREGCLSPVPGIAMVTAYKEGHLELPTDDLMTFRMGAQAEDPEAPGYDPDAMEDEAPPHLVTLKPFWIQRYEVSVEAYRWCVWLGPCRSEDVATGAYFNYGVEGRDDFPVNGVTWEGARRYCEWVGGRLPTEAEFEYVARIGPLSLRNPWDQPHQAPTPATCGHVVMGGGADAPCGMDGTRSAFFHSPSGGEYWMYIINLMGNVWEWTSDFYDETYYARSPSENPTGPDTGAGRVQRGGGWSDDDPLTFRAAFRAQMDPTMKMPDVGFRCVADRIDHPAQASIQGVGKWLAR